MEKSTRKAIEKLKSAGFTVIEGDGVKNIEELNRRVSLYTAYYEFPLRIDEYYKKHKINLNYD